MPTTCPARLSSGPPELPGLTAASNWMSPVRVCALGDRHRAVQPGHDAGAERVDQAERVPGGVHVVADLHAAAEHRRHDDARRLVGCEHGDVVVGLLGRDRRRRLRAVGERHLDRLGAVDDVPGGQDLAVGVDDDAGAGARRRRRRPAAAWR